MSRLRVLWLFCLVLVVTVAGRASGQPVPASRPSDPVGAPQIMAGATTSGVVNAGALRRVSFALKAAASTTGVSASEAGSSGDLIEDSASPFRTALGYQALFSNTTGPLNTAIGYQALFSNTTGPFNTAIGYQALVSNTTGPFNTAIGVAALEANITGCCNTAFGLTALGFNTSGNSNDASGHGTLASNTSGHGNTASGGGALYFNTTGSYNTAVGLVAGESGVEGDFNIFIGAFVRGQPTDANTIRIGLPYGSGWGPESGQNKTFIAGIVESPLSAAAAVVGIQPDGRVGTLAPELLPPGTGWPTGAILYMLEGATPPAGFVPIGSFNQSLPLQSGPALVLTINVYVKQ